MKTLLAFLAAFALSACAATQSAPVIDASARAGSAGGPGQTRVAAPVVVVAPADAVAALNRLGAGDSITTRQAAAMLGPPDVDRRDGVGALLTWRLARCALVLGFANDRLTSALPSARQVGAPSPTLAECVDEARARRPQG